MMRFSLVLLPSEEDFAVGCPTGCWSQGQNEEEALQNIREAIEYYLAVAEEMFSR